MRNRLWFSVWKNVNKTWEKKLLTLINDIILGGKARGFFNAKLRKATQNLTSLQKCLEVFLRRGKNLTSSLGRLSRRTCLQVFLMFLSIHLCVLQCMVSIGYYMLFHAICWVTSIWMCVCLLVILSLCVCVSNISRIIIQPIHDLPSL